MFARLNMNEKMERLIESAAEIIAAARRIAVLTGAGVSAESGVGTFRDAQTGLWSRFDPQQLASQEGFAADPGRVWRWYMHRLEMVEHARPNPGHAALAALEAMTPTFTLITQNVDDLHERRQPQRAAPARAHRVLPLQRVWTSLYAAHRRSRCADAANVHLLHRLYSPKRRLVW